MARDLLEVVAEAKLDEWNEEVSKQWFDTNDTETTDAFLYRAETFLR